MELWFIILISLSISALFKSIFNLLFTSHNHRLPPGPFAFPIIGNLQWFRRSSFDIEPILRSLHSKFGPIFTLYMGSRPAIFIADRSLAHQAFVQNGAVFADRPPALPIAKIINSNQHNINSASYGPTWRLFRRNLTAGVLHPSRVKSYRNAREWVLQILRNRIESQAKSGSPVSVVDHFQFSMFALLVLICFGDKLDETQIKQIEEVQRQILLTFGKFSSLNFWPRLSKIFMRRRWEELFQICSKQREILIPLVRARKELKETRINKTDQQDDIIVSYVDTLLNLELPDEKRKLEEGEIISLCSELLNGGTDTTSTALQWIMANLVKYPEIQEKLFMEIKGVISNGEEEEVKEEDLQNMPYLKAVILEGLRRHPPGHLLLAHSVREDVVLDKYSIPKFGTINVMIAEMGWDSKVWDDPMAFKPGRFLNDEGQLSDFDITGSREIKMMPFGVGRRICPAYSLAMLHLEYFVANLIWSFEWKAINKEDVDLSEKLEFTVVMKNPLQAYISPRSK